MTRSAGPALRKLHREYGDRVRFLTLYVREAHPGEKLRQPRNMAQKLRAAQAYADRDEISWPVLVDDLAGSLHQKLDSKAHTAYFVDETGRVAHRALWANDERALRKGLEILLHHRHPTRRPRNNRVVPLLRGTGSMYEVLDAAGEEAKADMRRSVPPVYGLGRLANVLRPLPPLARTVLAMGAVASMVTGLFVAARRGARRLRPTPRRGLRARFA